jgi:DNA-directed RNA polymerase subunit E'/Rpb7
MGYRGNSPIPSSFILHISALSSKTISSKSYMKMSREHVVVNMGTPSSSLEFDRIRADGRYIVSVISINSIGEGKVLPSTGQARFKTSYTAVVFKPFKGEVMDGRVTNVNKVSYLILRIDAPAHSQMGFFAMVGPLQVFVSSHVSLLPLNNHTTTPPHNSPYHDEL